MTVEIPGLGEFDDNDDGEWTATFPVEVVGEDVEFTVVPDDVEDSDDADALSTLAVCISNFRTMPRSALDDASALVYAYYQDFAEEFSEGQREDFGIPTIGSADDVWSYVTFGDEVSVERDDETGVWFIIWENECAWEAEHGLQLVIRNGEEVTRASEYDGFITE